MKTLIYSVLALGLSGTLSAKEISQQKQVKMQFDYQPGQSIDLNARNTILHIETWEQSQVELVATFTYKGEKSSSKLEEFIEEFPENVRANVEETPTVLRIKTFRSVPSKVKIGWQDFAVFNLSFSEEEIEIKYQLKVPRQAPLRVVHSYRDMQILGKLDFLQLEQYSGDLRTQDLREAKLYLKYGKAQVGRINTGLLNLYENDTEIAQLGKLKATIKYSELRCPKVESMQLIAYESEFYIEQAQDVQGELKYSRWDGALLQNLMVSTYECKFQVQNGGRWQFSSSKYSKYSLGALEGIGFQESYEDKLSLQSIGDLKSPSCKYFKHQIGTLNGDYVVEAYEGQLRIDALSAGPGKIDLKGKYTDMLINSGQEPFRLEADLNYGKVSLPRQKGGSREVESKSNHTKAKMQTANYQKGKGFFILVNGYETDLQIL